MARYIALKHLRVGEFTPAPGDPLSSEDGDGRDWSLMVRVGEVAPWPTDKAWTGGGNPVSEQRTSGTPATIAEGGGWLTVMDGETKVGKATRDRAEAEKIKADYDAGKIDASGSPVESDG